MIVPTVDNSFFSSLASAVGQYLGHEQYHTIIYGCENDAQKEKAAFQNLIELQADGIICVSGLSTLPKGLLPENYPLVWVDRVPDSKEDIPWVANDDKAAMEMATGYLIEKGSKNILLLPGYLAEHQESPRVVGYRDALEKHGIPWKPEFVLNRKGKKNSEVETEELVKGILQQGHKIDGIITSSDRAAFGAMVGLRSVGFYVPEDVRLISFDNSPYSNMATPAITAIDRNPKGLAATACETLLKLICHETVSKENIVPALLVKRDSTR